MAHQIEIGDKGVEYCETFQNSLLSNSQLITQHNNDLVEFSLQSIYFKEKENYIQWGKNKFSHKYINSLNNKLNELFKHIKGRNPKEILNGISKYKLEEKYTRKAIRNFLNYIEEKELLNNELINNLRNKIKIIQTVNIDNYVPNKEKITDLLNSIKEYCNLDYILVRVLLESGIRLTEIEHFIKSYNKDKIEINGNIITYPLMYLRGNKTSYYIFFTEETYELLSENITKFKDYKIDKLKNHIKRYKLLPLKYIRKYQFTQMIKAGIDFEIANFIQGRASKNIGINHYLAKKEIALKEYKKLI